MIPKPFIAKIKNKNIQAVGHVGWIEQDFDYNRNQNNLIHWKHFKSNIHQIRQVSHEPKQKVKQSHQY